MPKKVNQAALKRACERYPQSSPRVAMIADFIETFCTLSKGKGVSEPFVLVPWQYEVLEGVYGGNPGDPRKITRALISMARKNGKTEFCSALVLVHLCGPESGRGQQIVCAAAASQEQASLVFDGAVDMSKANPTLRSRMTYRINRLIWDIGGVNNYAMTISTKPSTAQGLLPAVWFYDEIAEAKSRDLYEALNYSQTDNELGGLGFIISTRSTNPSSLFSVIHDEAVIGQQNGINDHWYVKVYSADPKAENVFTMEELRKANPSLGYFLQEDLLEKDLQNAIFNTSARSDFRARRLNIDSGSNESLIDPYIWSCAAVDDYPVPLEDTLAKYKGQDVVLGIDLGSTTSMTSLAMYFRRPRIVVVKNWMAKSQVKNNELKHKSPYGAWAEAGYIELISHEHHGGMTYQPIADFINRIIEEYDVKSFRYDGWNATRLFDALKVHDLNIEQYPLKGILDKFVQGTVSYGEAIIEFEDAMFNGTLKHDNNPCTNMSMRVCQVEVVNRTTENLRKPAKNKQEMPNDAAVAILMAISQRSLVSEADDIEDEFIDGWGTPGVQGIDTGLSDLL